jgi:hypothetical protein
MLMSTLLEVVHKLPRLVAADLQQRLAAPSAAHGSIEAWNVSGVARYHSLTVPVHDVFYAQRPEEIADRLHQLGYCTDGLRFRAVHSH